MEVSGASEVSDFAYIRPVFELITKIVLLVQLLIAVRVRPTN